MEQVIGIDTQGAQRELPEFLGIEEGIGPRDFSSLFVAPTVGRSTGWPGRVMPHAEFHRGPRPQRSSNCLTLSKSEAAWGHTVRRTDGREELEGNAWWRGGGEESRALHGGPTGRSHT